MTENLQPNLTPQDGDITTDVLVVGSGPAGSSAALFLASYGINHLVVSKYSNTANTPRAHITNQRTFEIMRDMGVEEELKKIATPHEMIGETVFCTAIAGEEFGRLRSWGTHPLRHGDYETASPSMNGDVPQTRFEPLVVRSAMARGSKFRWSTEFLTLVQDDEGVHTLVRDRLSGATYTIHSRYVIGADGGRSQVAETIGLPLEGEMGKSGSMNIWCDMDLSDYCENRQSSLYWVLQPGASVGGIGLGLVRMVEPWTQWLVTWGYDINGEPPVLNDETAADIVRDLVGLPDLDVTVRDYSLWTVNELYATKNMEGRVFCVGDAVHRHPPGNGLGSNTSIADSYNLAWKIAMVLRGQAGPELLETYDEERVPVARQIVRRANKSIEEFGAIFDALGFEEGASDQQLREAMDVRKEHSARGEESRRKLREAMKLKNYEFNAHGVELGQRYRSRAVKPDGTPEPVSDRDPQLYYQPTTWPGAKIPHAWLADTQDASAARISTFDLCGHGRFTVLTGVNGTAWVDAAERAAEELGLDLAVHRIGAGQEYDDLYGDWAEQRGVEDSGMVLVRPDLHVAYRVRDDSGDPASELVDALREVTFAASAHADQSRVLTRDTHW